MSEHLSRRGFVASIGALGAGWVLGDDVAHAEARAHARHQVARQEPELVFLTREQAAEVEAFASRIIPTDDAPGAREAGVVYFIDKSLTTWARDSQGYFLDGLEKLARDVAAVVPGQSRLSTLSDDRQDAVIRSIENAEFFGYMRYLTLAGTLSLPEHGGNRDFVGWGLVGQQHALEFRPPFGWYDDPANRRALLGGDE